MRTFIAAFSFEISKDVRSSCEGLLIRLYLANLLFSVYNNRRIAVETVVCVGLFSAEAVCLLLRRLVGTRTSRSTQANGRSSGSGPAARYTCHLQPHTRSPRPLF